MLFNKVSFWCPSPDYTALEVFDFDCQWTDDSMSPDSESSSSPGNESMPSPHPEITNTSSSPHDHESSYSDEPSDPSTVPLYVFEGQNPPDLGSEAACQYLHVSPFNYPVNPESSYLSSTSTSANSPSLNSESLAMRPKYMENFPSYGIPFLNASEPPRTSVHEENTYSPFRFTIESNQPMQYPNYNVSAPSTTSTSPPVRQRAELVSIAPYPQGSSSQLGNDESQGSRPEPVLIAPYPQGSSSQLDDDECQGSRKRRATPTRHSYPVKYRKSELNEEERELVHLKEDIRLPWKEIMIRFEKATGHKKTESALQMQYKRLKDRIRVWTDHDLIALFKAIREVGNMRWEAISQAMLNFGNPKKWPKEACQRKWESLDERELGLWRVRDWSDFHQFEDHYSPDSSSSVTSD